MQPSRQTFDIAIIGGGINGCGIARDAAGRGWRVLLLEQDDLASGTSAWSTKLIHGGLRYLEHGALRLVREALIEREVLWGIAPHLVRPMRFVLPHQAGQRPALLLRLGLLLYDHIGGRRRLPATRVLDLARDEAGMPLAGGLARKGFEYSDCTVDDARLGVLNARDAADRGATILTRSRVVGARRSAGGWEIDVQAPGRSGRGQTFTARTLVNAAGPWVEQVLGSVAGARTTARVRLVQGSHIVVPRLYAHDRAYLFQNSDGRVLFVIPYEEDFSLIGTTDRDYHGDPAQVAATEDEIAYLIEGAGRVLRHPIARRDVVWAFSGVRPLYDDGASQAQEATRDYVLETDGPAGRADLVSVFGGKITTYRRLAEAVLDRLAAGLGPAGGERAGWTAGVPLPGGDLGIDGQATLWQRLVAERPWLGERRAQRLARSYGTRALAMLGEARAAQDLGADLGAGLSEREVGYLVETEWAQTADDVLWRRSKLGLRLTRDDRERVESAVRRARARLAPIGSGQGGGG